MKPLRYHPDALAELRAAVAFDEREHPGRGVYLQRAIERLETRLQRLPFSAPPWLDAQLTVDVRRARITRTPYLMIYAVFSHQLVALAIAHQSRQPGYWMARTATGAVPGR